jgi:hypothetical protein
MVAVFNGAPKALGLACVIWVRRCDTSILAARSLVVFSDGRRPSGQGAGCARGLVCGTGLPACGKEGKQCMHAWAA